jgi:mitochondrial import inner membrane translocase subunit TIM21
LLFAFKKRSKMSPNRVFDRSFDIIRKDPEVLRRYGDALKAYGRDHGGHREGRRNFCEHTEYVDKDDGSRRTRVRFNIEGRFGTAFCFAEVSNQMPSGEFVYVLVQDKSNGRVHAVIDNRAALTAARLTSGSKEGQSAMAQLLSGGK